MKSKNALGEGLIEAADRSDTFALTNDEIAKKLMELHTILIVADYPEDHAARYPRLAYTISRMEASVAELVAQGQGGMLNW